MDLRQVQVASTKYKTSKNKTRQAANAKFQCAH